MNIEKYQQKYINHLQKLTAKLENLIKNEILNDIEYHVLYERSQRILRDICPDESTDIKKLISPSENNVKRLIGKLRAAHLDFVDGILSIKWQIDNEVSIDLMQQAEDLLKEGTTDQQYSYVPAAVLTGAILERFLKNICERQSPPIPLTLKNGNQKTLAPIVDDLEKINLYNAVEKQQLKVWVKIRNNAAHGNFEEFNREQVIKMVQDVKRFMEEHEPG